MTDTTMDRAILDRLIFAWDSTVLPKSRDSMMQECMERLRAELAKPTPYPAWHDAPTEPGLWHVKMHPHSHPASVIEVLVTDVKAVPTHCRWYGPIPQDDKAEGGAA